MKTIVKNILKKYGYDLVPNNKNGNDNSFPPDLSDDEKDIFNKVKPFTMTSIERSVSLIQAVKYVVENKIEGDFVECGVWRGGSMMIVALVLRQLGDTSRKLYLYDTFEGMPAPSGEDVDFQGKAAAEFYKHPIIRKIKYFSSKERLKTRFPKLCRKKSVCSGSIPIGMIRQNTNSFIFTRIFLKTAF